MQSSFSPSFLNWEIIGPYQFLLKIILNIPFVQLLHTYLYKYKNMLIIWKELSSFIYLIFENTLLDPTASLQIERLSNRRQKLVLQELFWSFAEA